MYIIAGLGNPGKKYENTRHNMGFLAVDLLAEKYDIRIDKHCAYLGKSIGELNIWQQTGATIVAIKRSTDYVISPGPYERIQENDVILFVGNELSKQRMNNLFDVIEESEEAEE